MTWGGMVDIFTNNGRYYIYIYVMFVRVLTMFYSIIRVSMSFTMILNIIELMFSSKMNKIIRDVLVELELMRIAFSDINRFRTKIVLLYIKHNKENMKNDYALPIIEWWTWIVMKHIYMGHVYLFNMYMHEFNAFIHTKLPRHTHTSNHFELKALWRFSNENLMNIYLYSKFAVLI